jgi:hypothetical protein
VSRGGYWPKVLIGLLLAGGAIVAVDWGLYHVVRTGSCGADEHGIHGPPCPPGTGLHILALVLGAFVGLAGIGLWASRAKRGTQSRMGLGLVMWSLLFITLPLAMAVSSFGPAHNPDNAGAQVTTIVLGAVFIPLGLAPLPLAFGLGRKRRLAAQLVATGQRCSGEVLSVEDTNVTINDNPRVRITVRAEPPGEEPFTVVKTATVSRVAIPRAGDRCTVFYDPADRLNRNGITFDAVPASLGGGPVSRRAARSTVASVQSDEGDEDPIVKIEKLGQLRDRGLITQDEFDAQKQRLLGEV